MERCFETSAGSSRWRALTRALVSCLALVGSGSAAVAQTSPQGFALQGRILKNDGSPLENALVIFKVRIRSPGIENCILYEETHQLPMATSDGIFSLPIGSGTREANSSREHTSTLAQALSNAVPIAGPLNCAAPATTYTPSSTHERLIEVSFNDGTGFQAVAEAVRLNAAPYSLYADTLQGRTPGDFIQRNSSTAAVTQTNLEGVFASTAYVNELVALITGNSAQYVKTNGAGFVPTAAVSYNNQRITNLSNPTAAQDAATKDYADKQIGGKIVDVTITNLAAGDSGKVLSWDGTKWVATSLSTTDATKLPLEGGTMTGAITMGGNNILQTGHITMNPGRYLHLGTYDDSTEATLVGSLTGAHKGAIWYNTTENVIKHWNGSAAIASGPIADNAVTTAKIADGAVTTPKLFANPGVNRIVATDGTLGATLAPMSCSTVGHVLKWTVASGFQCAADDGGQWTTTGSNISFSSGNVGVGTTSPSFPVHVSTAVTNTYTTSSASLALPAGEMLRLHNSNNALNSYSGLTFVANRADGVQQRNFIGGVSNGGGRALDMVFGSQTGGAAYSEYIRIIGLTGNVGIGTASPAVGLDLSGRTDAVRLPLGTSAQRPTAANGLLRYNTETNKFEAYENGAWTNVIGAGGTVTSVTAGTGLTGGPITSSGTIAVNVGTGANQIVQLDGSSRLPAVDGSQLTNLSGGAISSGTLPIARGGTNSNAALNNNRLMVSNGGAIVEAPALSNGQLLIGSTGAAPVAAALLAGTGISITNGAGSITIAATSAPPTGAAGGDLTGTYPDPTIGANAVTTAKINDAAVTAAKIADGAVATAKIADAAITTPKLFATPGRNRIVGTDATSGATLAPMSCATDGHVLKWSASNGFQCSADDTGSSAWTSSGADISYTAGQVGIGTSSPSALLNVRGSANGGVYSIFDAATQFNGAYKLISLRSGGVEFGFLSPSQIYMNDSNVGVGAANTVTLRGQANVPPNVYGFAYNGARIGVMGINTGTTSTGAGVAAQATNNPALVAESLGTINDAMIVTSRTLTTGRLANFEQVNSAFSGDALRMNLGQGTGSFTGNFLNFQVNSSNRFIVTSSGRVGVGTASPAVSLDLSSQTDAVSLPSGNTSQRPSGANGQIRYNSQTNKFEGFENGAWTNVIGGGASTGPAGGDLTGTYPDPTIANNAVTAAKIANGAVTTAKLSGGTTGVNRIIATDGTSGTTVAPITCATVGHVLKWTVASGFQCSPDDGSQWTTSGSDISYTAGRVGVGTATPRARLDVNGAVVTRPSVSVSGSTVDFSQSNLAHTSSNCGSFALHHLQDGGFYTFAVKGTSATTCSFTAFSDAGSTPLVFHLPPDHSATTASTHTVYTFMVMGGDVYTSWVTGL